MILKNRWGEGETERQKARAVVWQCVPTFKEAGTPPPLPELLLARLLFPLRAVILTTVLMAEVVGMRQGT